MIEVAETPTSLVFNEPLDGDNMVVPLCLNLVGVEEIGTPFTVELRLQEDSSTATLGEDVQYGLPGSSPTVPATTSIFIEFPRGTVLRSCGMMSILSDDIFEEPEMYMLRLSVSVPYDIPINPDRDSFTIHIINDPSGKYISLVLPLINH